jgi:hypothetical protein
MQYGEHFLDFEDFHILMVQILSKPGGIYSFFNGLAQTFCFFTAWRVNVSSFNWHN